MNSYQISQEDFEKYQQLTDEEKIAFMYFLLKERFVKQRSMADEVQGNQVLIGIHENIIVLKTKSKEALDRELQAIAMDGYILRRQKLKNNDPDVYAYRVIGKNYPISCN